MVKLACAALGASLGLFVVGIGLLVADSYRDDRRGCTINFGEYPEESQYDPSLIDAIENVMVAGARR